MIRIMYIFAPLDIDLFISQKCFQKISYFIINEKRRNTILIISLGTRSYTSKLWRIYPTIDFLSTIHFQLQLTCRLGTFVYD